MSVSIRRAGWSGFTLVEMLVVIAIVVIVSAATIPAIIPALENRRVSEAARVFQAALAGARDSAIRANSPRGIRLLPDPVFFPKAPTNAFGYRDNDTSAFASSSYVPIETGPAYSEGVVQFVLPKTDGLIQLREVKASGGLPNPPTSWYWNIRVGEQLRIDGTGLPYTIRGPMVIPAGRDNPEGFINNGTANAASIGIGASPQVLFLSNGIDDDGDGFADEGFDGLDNDRDGVTDPGVDGVDNDGDGTIDNAAEFFYPGTNVLNAGPEYESEEIHGGTSATFGKTYGYTIDRRPVPAQGSRVTTLPGGVVIDLTTWNLTRERSRLPVDNLTGYVDILLAPNGQVIPTQPGLVPAGPQTIPFFHFWLTDRGDVHEPVAMRTSKNDISGAPRIYYLPMLEGTNAIATNDTRVLEGERRLVTIHTRTGMIVTNPVEAFNAIDPDLPYFYAQKGEREAR